MSLLQVFYLSLLSLCLGVAVTSWQLDRKLRLLTSLLACSLLTEILVSLCYYVWKVSYAWIYILYVPTEHALLTLYLRQYVSSLLWRKVMLWTIPLYVVFSAYFSVWVLGASTFIGTVVNVMAIMQVGWCILVLFSVEPVARQSLLRLPVFWICIGLLVFYAGTFLFEGSHKFLMQHDTALAELLRKIFIKGFNYLLYAFITFGYLCLHRQRKFYSSS